ncbi:uncharacterized protein G2W53_013975 [Senna tora]|uniref:Uncharacterized protein n=1 Tax=Senna tora TaxID=362788 RepID=A0A834U1G0_9FABA|nr:uncharacterized protein G2W53_013975 [Senna tora]
MAFPRYEDVGSLVLRPAKVIINSPSP